MLAALRYWQANFDNEPADLFEDHFFNVLPLNADEIDELCEELNSHTIGYIVLNLSRPLFAGDGKYNFYVVGEEATSYGKLEEAVSQVAQLIQENGHVRNSVSIYALHLVPSRDTDSLIKKALRDINT